MGTIYGESELTIIAAHGHNATSGLPGLSRRRSQQQTSLCTRRKELLLWTEVPEFRSLLTEDKWHAHGWTFQERLLSRRCLFFFESETFFEDEHIFRRESYLSSMELDVLEVNTKRITMVKDTTNSTINHIKRSSGANTKSWSRHMVARLRRIPATVSTRSTASSTDCSIERSQ